MKQTKNKETEEGVNCPECGAYIHLEWKEEALEDLKKEIMLNHEFSSDIIETIDKHLK